MGVYLRAKFDVSSLIITSFKQGGGEFYPPPISKRTPKKATQIRVKWFMAKTGKLRLVFFIYFSNICDSTQILILLHLILKFSAILSFNITAIIVACKSKRECCWSFFF